MFTSHFKADCHKAFFPGCPTPCICRPPPGLALEITLSPCQRPLSQWSLSQLRLSCLHVSSLTFMGAQRTEGVRVTSLLPGRGPQRHKLSPFCSRFSLLPSTCSVFPCPSITPHNSLRDSVLLGSHLSFSALDPWLQLCHTQSLPPFSPLPLLQRSGACFGP